jgi:hypothetical protein
VPFIWSELFTTGITGQNRHFSSKKNKKAFGTPEKGFAITRNHVAGVPYYKITVFLRRGPLSSDNNYTKQIRNRY